MNCEHRWLDRKRAGPTGRRFYMLLVDECYKCKKFFPVHPEQLTYQQARWIERWNRRIEHESDTPD